MKAIKIGYTKESKIAWLRSRGCIVNTTAKTIARPKDALGQKGLGVIDGLCTHDGFTAMVAVK